MKFNWGTGITLIIIVFILMTLAFVTVAMRQNIDLVAENYYEQDLDYENKIEQYKNAQSTGSAPEIRQDTTGCISIRFAEISSGTIFLYRPSDKNSDVKASFTTDDSGKWQICPDKLASGAWKVYVSWENAGLDCYSEYDLFTQN